MVDDAILEAIQQALGTTSRSILVTGGSGFVGSRLAAALATAGHDVTATGRNPYRVPLQRWGVSFERADVRDSAQMHHLCRNKEIVFHAAAKSEAWGRKDDFHSINVIGTRNVVDACLQAETSRLVHVSSTAIFFAFCDRPLVKDDDAMAEPFANDYAATKAAAEEVVRQGVARGLNAITVRARAIFGPGDNSLLPRLIDAAHRKRLRVIGNGENLVDMTYIDNLILALALASVHGEPGAVCTVTNDQPVALWPLIRETLEGLGVHRQLARVPYRRALAAATAAEAIQRWRNPSTEPVITRYAVGLLAKTQTFDQQRAKETLHYQPLIDMATGIRRTVAAMQQRDERCCEAFVDVSLFTTGFTTHAQKLAERGGADTPIRFHAAFALLDHPTYGKVLFDTGYSTQFFVATKRWPYRLLRHLTPVTTSDGISANAMLDQVGVRADEIRLVILSHFHPDHIGGVHFFPHADFVATRDAWNAIRGKRGMSAVRRAFLPELLPTWFADRLYVIDRFHDPGFGPFAHTHDVFGDGSIRLVHLPGHAHGQCGALVMTGTSRRVLLAADACWTSRSIRDRLPPTAAFRWIADSTKDAIVTQQKVADFHEQFPEIEILPTHCPEVATRYRFNQQLDDVCGNVAGVPM